MHLRHIPITVEDLHLHFARRLLDRRADLPVVKLRILRLRNHRAAGIPLFYRHPCLVICYLAVDVLHLHDLPLPVILPHFPVRARHYDPRFFPGLDHVVRF